MGFNNVDKLSGFCTGCAACVVACPVNVIRMDMNDEGFFVANIREEDCIDCGKCLEVCIRAGVSNTTLLGNGEIYAAQSKNADTITKCTSGGLAYEMSCHALNKKMKVVGVIYDYENNIARTVLANNHGEISAFRGSKYIQSKTDEVLKSIVHMAQMDSNSQFLVFGTPCQIFGLAKLLENMALREHFILVDLFCHGVPSYLVWESYRRMIEKKTGEEIFKEVCFREKSIGWHNFVMLLRGSKGIYKKSSEGDLFYRAFFDNVLLGRACFDCMVRKEYSKADIRLGDFWGKRYQNREDGISVVLILTKAGANFYNETPNINRLESDTVSNVLRAQSIHDYDTLPLRACAFQELKETKDLKKTIRHYRYKFPIRKRSKILLKELSAYFPDSFRKKLRQIYRSSKG